jgi:hypothetical protein
MISQNNRSDIYAGGPNMYCLKISLNTEVVGLHEFPSSDKRKQFLRKLGFVEALDVWYHPFTKEVAGLFEKHPGQCAEDSPLYNSCDKRFTTRPKRYL